MKNINKASAFASAAHPFYEANSIPEEAQAQLEDTARFLISLTRRSTEEAFDYGEKVNKAAGLLPEGTLEKWAFERCGCTARHVRTQRAIYRNLASYKDVLVELAVGPTVLGKLSSATPEQIEQAIGFAGLNGRLRVQDVVAIMAGSKQDGDEKPEVDPYDAGGLDGLKAIIAMKVRDGMKSFVGHVEEIRVHVKDALPKNNIVKKALAEQTSLTARLAHRELESLAEFVTPNARKAYVIDGTRLPAGSRWAAVSALLYKMGSDTSWPDKAELRTWLETEVVPLLNWVAPEKAEPTTRDAKTKTPTLVADEPVPAEPLIDLEPEAASAPTLNERLTSIAEAFGATATIDLPQAVGEDDLIPTVTEALATTEKRFQRPAFLGKAKPTSPPSATA
ncbi:hypothetical protein [Neorhizobium galegae]|uniref:Uncharacterized protein n=1 Tax=Neorhizobium galegae bv. officinalis TaxID=323656 RepID=A0A0T7GVN3_NEOGA|nr:hypothetical protein [Neorhizobium galegae]CDZ51187.1 Hypothetical protein NGAL_HAMBI1189_38420 [Neorhizobium galegae bv. officinalis]